MRRYEPARRRPLRSIRRATGLCAALIIATLQWPRNFGDAARSYPHLPRPVYRKPSYRLDRRALGSTTETGVVAREQGRRDYP